MKATSNEMLIPQPDARSASCLLVWSSEDKSAERSLLLIAGDSGLACKRLSDVWFLNTGQALEGRGLWQQVQTSGPAPQPRSNHAAAVAGSKLVIFGGWDNEGTSPLADLRVLDLEQMRWTEISTLRGQGPSPRGQPCMLALTEGNRLAAFGGWDGHQRFNDLHLFDTDTLEWTVVSPLSGVKPPARADHSCSKWWYCDDGVWKDIMVCFGGSTSEGTQNDVWLFDFRWEEWTQAFCAGDGPSPRSSHASSVVGDLFITVGGQSRGEVFSDCHILYLVSLTWRTVEIPGLGPLCRHSLAVCTNTLWGMGGFDGTNSLGATFAVSLIDLLPQKAVSKQKPRGLGDARPADKVVKAEGTTLQGIVQRAANMLLGALGWWESASCVKEVNSEPRGLSREAAKPSKPDLEYQLSRETEKCEIDGCGGTAGVKPEANAIGAESGQLRILHLSGSRRDCEGNKNGEQIETRHTTGAEDTAGPNEGEILFTSHTTLRWAWSIPTFTRLCEDELQDAKKKTWLTSAILVWVIQGDSLSLAGPFLSPTIQHKPSSEPEAVNQQHKVLAAETVFETMQEPFSVADMASVHQHLHGWRLQKKLHEEAVLHGRDTYIDPPTGYTVFTARYLQRRPCCGNKCRHCPWAYANVSKKASEPPEW